VVAVIHRPQQQLKKKAQAQQLKKKAQSDSEPAQLGNFANANVEIYKVENDGSLVLKWSETTSNGITLDEIGKFNTHSAELEDNSFYLYKVSGGEDWDANDDGVLDSSATPNSGTIRP